MRKKTTSPAPKGTLKSTYDNVSHTLRIVLCEYRDNKDWYSNIESMSLVGLPENIRQVVIKTMRYSLAVANGTNPKAKHGEHPSLTEKLMHFLVQAASEKGNSSDSKVTVKTVTPSSDNPEEKAEAKTPE